MTSAEIGREAERKGLRSPIHYTCRRCGHTVVVEFDWTGRSAKKLGWRFLPAGDPNGNAHCPRCLSLLRQRGHKRGRRR